MGSRLRYGPRFNGSVASSRIAGHPGISGEPVHNPYQFMTPLQREFAVQKSRNTRSKDKITLAGPDMRIKKRKPGEERAEAEQRMIERIQRAVEIMTFGIEELSQCQDVAPPNVAMPLPTSLSRLADLTISLAKAGRLPAPEFVTLNRMTTRINSRRCSNCGDHFISQGWSIHGNCPRCEDTKHNTRLAEISAERRSREQAAKWVAEDVKRMTRIINQTEKKARRHD
jgi:hypothetical protein